MYNTILCKPLTLLSFALLKVLWRTDQLHIPGGSEDELFLAQPNGGRILHPGAQALLP